MSTNPQSDQLRPFEVMNPEEQEQHLATGHSRPRLPAELRTAEGRAELHARLHTSSLSGPEHEHASLEEHVDGLVQLPPETAYDRAWYAYDHALARATGLARLSEQAWEGADRHGRVVTYGDSGVPCHEVAAMFAAQAQAWAAVALARHASMGGGA